LVGSRGEHDRLPVIRGPDDLRRLDGPPTFGADLRVLARVEGAEVGDDRPRPAGAHDVPPDDEYGTAPTFAGKSSA